MIDPPNPEALASFDGKKAKLNRLVIRDLVLFFCALGVVYWFSVRLFVSSRFLTRIVPENGIRPIAFLIGVTFLCLVSSACNVIKQRTYSAHRARQALAGFVAGAFVWFLSGTLDVLIVGLSMVVGPIALIVCPLALASIRYQDHWRALGMNLAHSVVHDFG